MLQLFDIPLVLPFLIKKITWFWHFISNFVVFMFFTGNWTNLDENNAKRTFWIFDSFQTS